MSALAMKTGNDSSKTEQNDQGSFHGNSIWLDTSISELVLATRSVSCCLLLIRVWMHESLNMGSVL